MRAIAAIAAIVVSACSFSRGNQYAVDAAFEDAPPTIAAVYFVSITASSTTVRPGRYAIEVTAVLRSELDVEITEVAAGLTFGGRDAELRFRDADLRENVMAAQPDVIPAGGEATYRFVVDALPWLSPGDVMLDGEATFVTATGKLSATPLATPAMLQYTGVNTPIVVDLAQDERDTDPQLSLREAIEQANNAPGPDRIVFAPAAYPAGTVVTLSSALGELPPITSDLVIDATGASVTLAASTAWETSPGRYGLRINGGNVAIAGLTFRNFASGYPYEDVSTNNCGTATTAAEGGAIRIDGGTVALDRNRFEDPAVAERNCWAAAVRIHGGSRHRILGNTWTDQVMDSIYVAASVVEITNNVMISPTNPGKDDEGVYIASQGGADLWITGNLIVDNEFSGVRSGGTDAGKLYIVNNTFVRNGRTSLSALRRDQATRQIVLRNNLYVSNKPSALQTDNNGTGFDVAYETIFGSPLCNGACPSAMIDMATLDMPAGAGVENPAGSTPGDFTPMVGSTLVDTATPWLDRNAGTPRRYNGTGQERGAVELP